MTDRSSAQTPARPRLDFQDHLADLDARGLLVPAQPLPRRRVGIAVVQHRSDEAVELAKRFSTDDSGRFVNGVLSAMVPVLRG